MKTSKLFFAIITVSVIFSFSNINANEKKDLIEFEKSSVVKEDPIIIMMGESKVVKEDPIIIMMGE
ncbi:hypothetical protein [Labilibacter marinus]|uniref:hypothetical protein n=1 Tax=Labilibacter marinus TaxID=1477105 RepID=UPI00082EC848|nr:hypothetical protein [Labilibacter marinus]